MKSLLTTILISAVLVLIPSCGDRPEETNAATPVPAVAAPAPAPEEVVAEITQLEKDWASAIVNKDVASLDRLLAPDFNGTSPTASTFPRSFAIDELKAGTYTVAAMDLDEIFSIGEPEQGQTVFERSCQSCHSFGRGTGKPSTAGTACTSYGDELYHRDSVDKHSDYPVVFADRQQPIPMEPHFPGGFLDRGRRETWLGRAAS